MAGSIFQHRDNRHATFLSVLGDVGRSVAKGAKRTTRRVEKAQRRNAASKKRPPGKARPRAVVRKRPQIRRAVQRVTTQKKAIAKRKKKPQAQKAIMFV